MKAAEDLSKKTLCARGQLSKKPEAHPLRAPNSTPGPGQQLHGHVGPVNHIPIPEEL